MIIRKHRRVEFCQRTIASEIRAIIVNVVRGYLSTLTAFIEFGVSEADIEITGIQQQSVLRLDNLIRQDFIPIIPKELCGRLIGIHAGEVFFYTNKSVVGKCLVSRQPAVLFPILFSLLYCVFWKTCAEQIFHILRQPAILSAAIDRTVQHDIHYKQIENRMSFFGSKRSLRPFGNIIGKTVLHDVIVGKRNLSHSDKSR